MINIFFHIYSKEHHLFSRQNNYYFAASFLNVLSNGFSKTVFPLYVPSWFPTPSSLLITYPSSYYLLLLPQSLFIYNLKEGSAFDAPLPYSQNQFWTRRYIYLFIWGACGWNIEYVPPPLPQPATSVGKQKQIYISPPFFYLFYSAINTIFIKYEVPWAGRATIFLRWSDNAIIGQLIKAYRTPLNSKAFAPRIQNLVST